MLSVEIPELTAELTKIAEALHGKAPTPSALEGWFDTLRECQYADIKAVLSTWLSANLKPPVPAQVLHACRERAATRREVDSHQRRSAPGFDLSLQSAKASDPEVARQHIDRIREIQTTPKPHPKAWAMDTVRRVLDRQLGPSHQMVRDAIRICLEEGWLTGEIAAAGLLPRDDVEDEREARLERDAIRTE